MLCISGFINDVMFSYNGSVAHYRVGQKTGPRTHNHHSFLTDFKKTSGRFLSKFAVKWISKQRLIFLRVVAKI